MTNYRGYNKNTFYLYYAFHFHNDAMGNKLLFPFGPWVNQGLERNEKISPRFQGWQLMQFLLKSNSLI